MKCGVPHLSHCHGVSGLIPWKICDDMLVHLFHMGILFSFLGVASVFLGWFGLTGRVVR